MTQPILITGGTGFIGSHTVVTLAAAGQPVVILDNLCNSSPKVLDRLARFSEGDDGVRANEARAASDQNGLCHTVKNL